MMMSVQAAQARQTEESPSIFGIAVILGGGLGMTVASLLGADGGAGFFVGATIAFLALAVSVSRETASARDLVRYTILREFIQPMPAYLRNSINATEDDRRRAIEDAVHRAELLTGALAAMTEHHGFVLENIQKASELEQLNQIYSVLLVHWHFGAPERERIEAAKAAVHVLVELENKRRRELVSEQA